MIKILITGCFDLLHNGHIQFIQNASKYGDELYVGVCSDENYLQTKGELPVYNEQERLYMIKSIKYVTDAMINSGTGKADFENVIQAFKPDTLIVNDDGFPEEKEAICKKYNMSLLILPRTNYFDLPSRSTSSIKEYLKKK